MSYEYNEDNLVEQATVDVLASLGWEIETAWGHETFGLEGLLGRKNKHEVILQKYLLPILKQLNPDCPETAYREAYLQIAQKEADKTLERINKEKYALIKNGIEVSYTNNKGELIKKRLRVFDFKHPDNNHFIAIRQLEVVGELYNRRPDVIGFVNGIPLVFIELKAHYRDLQHAYNDNLKDYKDTIPHLFHTNALVILSNGLDTTDHSGTKIGTITSPYKFFHEWKRINEDEAGMVSLDTTLRGTCAKDKLLDIFENFLLFTDSSNDMGGDVIKIMAKNHQYIGVNKALENTENMDTLKGKLGVFWHTQGSGKSFSMVFLSQKIHRQLEGSYTILVVLDRGELENQIYDTFTAVGAVTEKAVVATSRKHLRTLLKENHRYIFTLIHKFSTDPKKESEYPLLSERKDIIVLSDEAHRTQGGVFARNMRFNALPNASYIGFTGTPIFKGEEELTRNIFGEYVSVYDFKSAISDGATLPLLYLNKGDKLKLDNPDLDDEMAEIVENEDLDEDQRKKLERAFSTHYPILTATKRLRAIAKDLVWHFNERGYQGKAMFIAIDKPTAVRMYDYIMDYWPDYLEELKRRIDTLDDEQESIQLTHHYERVKATEICVVVSSEQNEIDKFKKQGLDITQHRKKMVERDLEKEFKDPLNPFRLTIVCAMWITGFDAPSISTIYLDKPIKGHTLMQTIARANRVYDAEKENGLIVDYGNVYEQLEEAYSVYGESGKAKDGNTDKEDKATQNFAELASELEAILNDMTLFLKELNYDVLVLLDASPIEKLALIKDAINAICLNETTRTQFEVMAREMFKKYKAIFPEDEVKPFVKRFNAIEAIYKGLNRKIEKADIIDIIVKLQNVVDDNIELDTISEKEGVYINLSHLDFDKLKKAYEKIENPNKVTYDLQQAIDKKLKKMLANNPARMAFYEKYLKIIDDYNNGKDAEATKKAFEKLVGFLADMDKEDHRAMREGLNEETLAIYDLLKKETLTAKEIKAVKKISKETLAQLKNEQLKIERWRESTQITAQVQTMIHDRLLYLPQEIYDDEDVDIKSNEVYQHIYAHYYGGGMNRYNSFFG